MPKLCRVRGVGGSRRPGVKTRPYVGSGFVAHFRGGSSDLPITGAVADGPRGVAQFLRGPAADVDGGLRLIASDRLPDAGTRTCRLDFDLETLGLFEHVLQLMRKQHDRVPEGWDPDRRHDNAVCDSHGASRM